MKYLIFITIIVNINCWIEANEESNVRVLRSHNKNNNLNEFDLNLNKSNSLVNNSTNDIYLDNTICKQLCKITENLKPKIRCLYECFKKEGTMSIPIVLDKCENSCDVHIRNPLCYLRCLKRRNEYA